MAIIGPIVIGGTEKSPKVDYNKIEHLYVDEKYSLAEVSSKLGVSMTTIWRHLTKLGVLRSRAEAQRAFHSKMSGKKSQNWRGGRYINKRDGYVMIYAQKATKTEKTKYIPEHILVWEQIHQIPLPKGWVVHHLNGIKSDNRPENLAALPAKKHFYILQAKAKRIRELEAKVKLLEQTLDSRQLMFHINEN